MEKILLKMLVFVWIKTEKVMTPGDLVNIE